MYLYTTGWVRVKQGLKTIDETLKAHPTSHGRGLAQVLKTQGVKRIQAVVHGCEGKEIEETQQPLSFNDRIDSDCGCLKK